MKGVVVYEPTAGNTRHVADAIADGLRQSIATEVLVVGDAFDIDFSEVKLVVAGAPTRALSPNRPNSRPAALEPTRCTGQPVESAAARPGIREWVHGLPRPHGCRGVAFDTRYDKQITDCAARVIQDSLRAAGFSSFGDPHSFRVAGVTEPFLAGEIERARQWGEAMGHMLIGMNVAWRLPRSMHRVRVTEPSLDLERESA